MRLIDADKLLQETWEVEIKDMFHMTETVEVVSAIDIKEAPTVNAIPIDFLREWFREWFGCNYNAFTDLMIQWEKENE